MGLNGEDCGNVFWGWMNILTSVLSLFSQPILIRIDEELLGDGHSYSPKAIHSWLTRAMYSRRSKMNPLWNTMVIGGYADGERLILIQITLFP